MTRRCFRRVCGALALGALLLPTAAAWAATQESYGYPFKKGLFSTILGTPREYKADLPKDVPTQVYKIEVWPGREIPDVFWYHDKMAFSFIPQKHKAPLIVCIAGTGGDYKTAKMRGMQAAFYQAGFHVLSVSSPTHPNFLVTASSSMVPGDLGEDAKDLYQALQMAYQRVKSQVEVSEFYVTGYSLGAAQAAYVAKLDETEQVFNFQKVLMINPPVSLFNSVDILDAMLDENVPGGLDNFNEWYKSFFADLAKLYDEGVFVEFNEDFIFQILRTLRERDPTFEPNEDRAKVLVGMAFRISSSSMVFTSDVMRKTNVIVPRDVVLTPTDSLSDFGKVATRMNFVDYFNEIFAQYYQAREPSVTKDELKRRASLHAIRDYLANSPKIGVVHNEDDIILAPGEIDFFREVFGERAHIYPRGGHCGNMDYPDNVAYMVGFFQN